MAELIRQLERDTVAHNLARVRAEVGERVEILAAIKYLPAELLPVLADAGITVVGENRAQELVAKQAAHGDLFAAWDFIGTLQSRKVKDLVGRVRYIHSVATDSALAQLARHGTPATQVLIEVNTARDPAKHGFAPEALEDVLARCPVTVAGLMTMPAQTGDPEASRPAFRELRALRDRHGLRELSMGTSQDYAVAVQEGATIVRLGSHLYRPNAT
jgi:uncharacterized pyridoxal phosphate-containing UPF0001 family protein